MTDAGVNSTATTFEHKGKQYVVVHAGGGVFANAKAGDGIWMFSLDGTIGPVVPQKPGATATAAALTSDRVPNRDNGAKIYRSACVPCHGATGEGGHGGGPTLLNDLTPEKIVSVTSQGRNNMPSFGTTLTGADLGDIAAYITRDLARKP
jgi:mono/diheme cytochrome c family protein